MTVRLKIKVSPVFLPGCGEVCLLEASSLLSSAVKVLFHQFCYGFIVAVQLLAEIFVIERLQLLRYVVYHSRAGKTPSFSKCWRRFSSASAESWHEAGRESSCFLPVLSF